MKRLILAALLLAIPIHAQDPGKVHLTAVGTPDGIERTYYASEATLKAQPAWDPSRDSPPLSLSKAVETGRTWAKMRHPRFDDLVLRGIQIDQVSCSGLSDRWFYMLSFDPIIDGQSFWGASIYALVLMDGTVVTPVETKKAQ